MLSNELSFILQLFILQDISQQTVVDLHDSNDKRPKLERARSAAEKENLPLQRGNNVLRRQCSQQDQPPQRRLSGVDYGAEQRSRIQPMTPQQQQQQQQQQQSPLHQESQHQQSQKSQLLESSNRLAIANAKTYLEDDPKYYQVSAIIILLIISNRFS